MSESRTQPTLSAESDRTPVRLGIIGTGLAAKRLHWPALAQLTDRFQVVAFANRTRERAEEFAALAGLPMSGHYHADYRALLDRSDVEAVLVGVPIPQLLSVARDCLAAGKHVICEKPPGANEPEAREFSTLGARFPGQKLLMAEHFFYRDELRLARYLADSGAIGTPRFLLERVMKYEVPTPGSFPSTPWRNQPAYPGGSILDGGVHSVAGMRLVAGDVTSLFARAERLNPTFGDAPSALAATFALASGASGNFLYGSFDTPLVESEQQVGDTRLHGTAGMLVAGRDWLKHVRSDGSGEEYRFPRGDAFLNEFVNFHDALLHDDEIVGTVAQSVKNMLLVLGALDSAERGAAVDLAQADWNQPLDGVPLWRPRAAGERPADEFGGLFAGLPGQPERHPLDLLR